MHDASRRLQDCLADMYDPEWFGKEEMDTLVEVRLLLLFLWFSWFSVFLGVTGFLFLTRSPFLKGDDREGDGQ